MTSQRLTVEELEKAFLMAPDSMFALSEIEGHIEAVEAELASWKLSANTGMEEVVRLQAELEEQAATLAALVEALGVADSLIPEGYRYNPNANLEVYYIGVAEPQKLKAIHAKHKQVRDALKITSAPVEAVREMERVLRLIVEGLFPVATTREMALPAAMGMAKAALARWRKVIGESK